MKKLYIVEKRELRDYYYKYSVVLTTFDKAEADAYVKKYPVPNFLRDKKYEDEYDIPLLLVIKEVNFGQNTETENPWQKEEDRHERERQEKITKYKMQITNALKFKASPLYTLMKEWNGNAKKMQPVIDYIDQHPDCGLFYETEKDKPKGESFTYMGTCFKVKHDVFNFGNWFIYYKTKFDFDEDLERYLKRAPTEVLEWYKEIS